MSGDIFFSLLCHDRNSCTSRRSMHVSHTHACGLGANVHCLNSQTGIISELRGALFSVWTVCVFSSSTNKNHLIIVSRCRDGCAASRGSAFKQLTSVNKSDWHMSEAAPRSVAAVSGDRDVWQNGVETDACTRAYLYVCVHLHVCIFTCVKSDF